MRAPDRLRIAFALFAVAAVVTMAVAQTSAQPEPVCEHAAAAAPDPTLWGILSGALNTDGFPRRWYCGTGWTPLLGWMHIVSDLLIWGSYMAIPAMLAVYMVRRRDVPFSGAGWLFVAFIFACGTGHLIEAGMFWRPMYRLAGLEKFLTAAVSVATVVALMPILPRALMLPGLAKVNAQLETEVAERKRAEGQLEGALRRERTLLQEMEHRVRNNLSSLLGLIGVYERSGKSATDAAAAIRAKVRAMIHVHELMSPDPGAPIDLISLIGRLTDHAVAADRRGSVRVEGPTVHLRAKQAGAMAMVLQELFTNSTKHGALASPDGRVEIQWRAGGEPATLEWTWRDRFACDRRGAPVEGVGLQLIRGFVSTELRGRCEFNLDSSGFSCALWARTDPAESPIRAVNGAQDTHHERDRLAEPRLDALAPGHSLAGAGGG